jgi:hypothetical protein
MVLRDAAFGLTLAVAALLASPAAAAPQILALLPTEASRPLECDGEMCRAEFSAICLQEERRVPVAGTAYELLRDGKTGGEPVLSLALVSGKTKRLDMTAARARFTSLRGQFAMAIDVPRAVLEAHGASGAAIFVEKTAFLSPVPVAGDDSPITVGEVRAVLGRHVSVAAGFERDVAAGLATTRVANALVNALPPGKKPKRADELAMSEAVLTRYAQGPDGPEKRAADDMASVIHSCDMRDFRQVYKTMRACVQVYHDSVMTGINTAYWKRVGKAG